MLDPGPSGARPVLWTAEDPLPGTFMVATRPRALAAGMKGGRARAQPQRAPQLDVAAFLTCVRGEPELRGARGG